MTETEEKLIMNSTLDLTPQTVREHLMALQFRQQSSENEHVYMKGAINDLKESRQREYKCPFNPDIGGDGHQLVQDVQVLKEDLIPLAGMRKEIDDVKTTQDKMLGALKLMQWLFGGLFGGVVLLLVKEFLVH